VCEGIQDGKNFFSSVAGGMMGTGNKSSSYDTCLNVSFHNNNNNNNLTCIAPVCAKKDFSGAGGQN